MASQYSPGEAQSSFDSFAKELEEESLMHYFTLAEQDLINDLDIGELEQEKRSLKIESFYRSVPPKFYTVTDVVDLQIENENYVRALILIKWANDYGKFDKHFNMSRLISLAYKIIRKKISKTDVKLLAIAVKYGEPLMVEMYEKIKQMLLPDLPDLPDIESKVRNIAISCQLITSVRGHLEMSREAIKSGEECIAMLENQFGENAKKDRTFGHALTVIGLSNKQLGDIVRGNEYLKEAIEAMRCATNFNNEGQKEEYIKYAQNLLLE